MARAIDPNARRIKILRADQSLPVEEQTQWPVRNLTVSEYTYLMDPVRASRTIVNALHLGLEQPTNFKDANGVDVILVRDAAANPIFGNIKPWSEESLSRIHPRDRDELCAEIIAHEQMNRGVAKNS